MLWRIQETLLSFLLNNAKLAEVMQKEGFTVSQNDPCLFMRGSGDSLVCVLVHVDDMAVVASS
jgi:hypothetical protein